MFLLRSAILIVVLSFFSGVASMALATPKPMGSAHKVLVSVHPLALLVKSAWPHLDVTALVPANQSPHDFSLRPSDLRKVASADSVVWLGNEFEPYLNKLMVKKSSQVDLSQITESTEMQGAHSEHEHHDPHLWLQPQQIPALLSLIQMELGLGSPQDFLTAYDEWLKQTQQVFERSKNKGFVSFHDAFHSWVEFFKLNQLDIVTLNPEKPVGTRHVVQVRNILASGKASCLFVEPQFQTRLLKKLTQGLSVEQVNIDPMASMYEVSGKNFLGFYQSLTQSFQQCLSN